MSKPSLVSRVWDAVYRYHYGRGVSTLRQCRRIGRYLGRVSQPLRRRLRYLWVRYAVRPIHRFFRRQKMLGGRMRPAFHQLRVAAKERFWSVFPCFWHLCRSAVKNYGEELSALGRLVGPVAAALAFTVTLSAWSGIDYCLKLTYHGQELGLIDSASVYDVGAALARGRVNNVDDSFQVDMVPRFTMTVRGGKSTMTPTQVCDAILRLSGDAIAQLHGLYVDEAFVGAMETEESVRAVLDSLKEGHYDKDDPHQRAEFVQAVEIVEGLYPISALAETAEELSAILTQQVVPQKQHKVVEGDTLASVARHYNVTVAQLRQMNPAYATRDTLKVGETLLVQRAQPRLQVMTVKTVTQAEVIEYKTKMVYRDDKPVTYSKVTTSGKQGSKDVTYEHVYLDGEEISVTRVGETVTKQPVTRVVEIGTKKTYTPGGVEVQQGDGIYTGKWTWPVPVCHNVYQGYHSRHLAWDISSGPTPVFNTRCLAVDGGRVVYAGWYYDYGYYVKIDHGNGLYTTYAHLNSISVVEGQLVTNGQMIGRVGNTGNSKGPHLHFEVIKNGVRVNPRNYIKP